LIEVYRYSTDGFTFKKQDYHLNSIKNSLDFFKKRNKFVLPFSVSEKSILHYSNIDTKLLSFGCHAFIGKPSKETSAFLLNHLSKEEQNVRTLYRGFIDKKSLVFTDTVIINTLDKYSLIPIENLKDKKEFAVIIPSNVIIYDIQSVS